METADKQTGADGAIRPASSPSEFLDDGCGVASEEMAKISSG